jgi:UDP-glucose 6-dehydrogenase
MTSYTARVELHAATYEDYEVLHNAMARQGFARTIEANDKSVWFLPTGTYDAPNTSADLTQATSAAEVAAKATKKNYSLIVVERPAAKWVGLTKKS